MPTTTARLTTRSSHLEFSEVLRDLRPFVTSGALSGRPVTNGCETGRMNHGPEFASFKAADYVVFSYSTPIAWHGPTGWTVTAARYSVTTSKHIGKIRTAVSSL